MKNANVQNYLINNYNKLAYTHNYIFGYVLEGIVYGAEIRNADSLLPYITSLDKASSKNGGTLQLKYKPNKAQLALIIEQADEIKAVCSVEYLENQFKNSKQNRGQIFETLVAKMWKAIQSEKKNAKFTDCGDIVDKNNVHFQVKYLKATFTDERTIQNLLKRV